jgi:hypothetical protein
MGKRLSGSHEMAHDMGKKSYPESYPDFVRIGRDIIGRYKTRNPAIAGFLGVF